jgi:hypothetical protein
MTVLLLTTQAAGILLVIGTMFLLFARRIYLDAETKQPIKFTLPVMGEISTQAPVLILIVIGAFMVVYPLSMMGADMATLEGDIDTGGKSVSVVLVAVPAYEHSQDAAGPLLLRVPLLATDATYRVKFIVDKLVIDDQAAELKNGRLKLTHAVRWAPPTGDDVQIPIRKDVSDEELRKARVAY